MTVIGEAFINVIAKTEGFEQSIQTGSSSGLKGLEHDAEASGITAGSGLGHGIESGAKDGLGKAEEAAAKSGSSMGGKVTGGLSSALNGLSSMFGLDFLDPLSKGADKAGEHMDGAKSKAGGLSSGLQSLGGGIALGAVAGLAAFSAEGVNLGATMLATDSKIAAAGDTSQAAAKKIGDAFLGTAGTTTFSGQQMATAYAGVVGQLTATAGHALSSKDALDVMRASTDAAEASGQSLDTVTGALAKTMQSFRLGAGDAAQASDLLYNASKATGMGLDSVAQMFAKLHTALGVNAPGLSTMSTLMVEFTKNGVTGKGAVAAMTTSLNALTNPTQKQSDALKLMGVNLTDANGKFIGMGPAMDALKGHLGENGNALDATAAKVLFGGKTLSQITPLIEGGSKAWDSNAQSVSKAGSAHDAAEKASANLHGQMEKLKSAVQDQATKWGEVLLPILTKVATFIVKLGTFVMDHKVILIAIAAVVGGIVVTAFVAWAASLWATVAAATVLGAPVLAVAAAIAAVIAIVVLLATHWKEVWHFITAALDAAWSWIKSTFASVITFFEGLPGKILGALASFGKMLLGWIDTAWQLLVHYVMAAFDLYIQFWTTLPLKIIAVLLRFGADLLGWITTAWNTLVSWVTAAVAAYIQFWIGLPGRVIGALAAFGSMLLGWFNSAWTWLTTTVSTGIGTVVQFFIDLPGKIIAAVVGFATMLVSAGSSLITGLVTGLVNDADKVGNKLLDIAKKALHSVLSFFGIGSPSKVFADIGSNLMLGLAGGIEQSAGGAHAAMMRATGALVGGVNATVSLAGVNGVTGGNVNPSVAGSASAGGQTLYVHNEVTLSADVSAATMSEVERMLQNNNADLARRLGALR